LRRDRSFISTAARSSPDPSVLIRDRLDES
jgi:hypothetical protein